MQEQDDVRRIARIGVGSTAKLSGAVGLAVGLFILPVLWIHTYALSLLPATPISIDTASLFDLSAVGLAAIIIVSPVSAGVSWFITGGLAAWFYNLYARRFGGIEIAMESIARDSED